MRLLLFVVLIIISSCKREGHVPNGVLPKLKMQAVMWDMIQADEFLKDYVFKDSTLNDTLESIKVYEKVFALHNTDRVTYDSSFNYYRRHPLVMKEMLDSLYEKSRQTAPTDIYRGDTNSRKPPVDTNKFERVRKMIRQD